jgi:acid phosphatase type 7
MLLGCISAAIQAEPASANSPDGNPTLVFPQFVAGQPIRLVAYGDMRFTDPAVTSGTNPRVRKWLADRIGEEHPDALLLTGDMPFTGASSADWQVFQAETARWREERIVQLPAPGNHEIKGDRNAGIANYLANFPSIGKHRYYSAILGSVEVISLDATLATAASSPQGKWFAAQLSNVPRQVEFLFILFHIPWMADRQSQIFVGIPNPEAIALRDILEARLGRIRAKVVVFNGHIHNYERFERRGVEYVITGGGGAEPYPLLFRGHADLYQDPGFPVYHYVTLEVSDHQVHAVMWKVKDPDAGALSVERKDEFTIRAAERADAEAVKKK